VAIDEVELNSDGDAILRKEFTNKAKEPEIKQEEPVVKGNAKGS